MSREDQSINNRKRCILYLIEKYLIDIGLQSSAKTLHNEALLQDDYEICDNIDLDTIFLEYCSFYNMKFNKVPKILKYKKLETKQRVTTTRRLNRNKELNNLNSNEKTDCGSNNGSHEETQSFEFKIHSLLPKQENRNLLNELNMNAPITGSFIINDDDFINIERKELVNIVCRDLVKYDYNLKWENISGNSNTIELLKEAIILPLEYPEYFTGVLNPWKAILLYGPPGTGKTLLAKTLCSETFRKVAFFYVQSSTITSKWRGESEKLIRALFETAYHYAPSIIFFDEIDGITSNRDGSTEHEASKRFKSEFLSLMDGTQNINKRVFILANTNIPWDIDAAFLRRFERKILVSLPNTEERKKIMKFFLPNSKKLSDKILSNLVNKCEGFTGDEIRIACKEAAMKQFRYLHRQGLKAHNPDSEVTETDLLEAFDQIQPVGQKLMNKYIEWTNEFGRKF